MEKDTEQLFYLGTGPLAAVLLGMALVPVRELTTASNLTFAFLVLTIAIAEVGGRWPALATAFASALSLDFFLTRPCLRLTIADKHDVIAFFGLAGCGLAVAILGSARRERIREPGRAWKRLSFLHAALAQSERGGALDSRLATLLDAARNALPIAGAVVRDSRERVLAASPPKRGASPAPIEMLDAECLSDRNVADVIRIPSTHPLDIGGVRLELVFDGERVGWLDVWGDAGRPADAESRRGLLDVGRLVALLLVTART